MYHDGKERKDHIWNFSRRCIRPLPGDADRHPPLRGVGPRVDGRHRGTGIPTKSQRDAESAGKK